MPYCPSCQTEYREGFDTCADCHVPLIEGSLPQPPPLPDPVDFGEPALLTTVEQVLDAEMLLTMLQDNDIPAFIKSHGIGGYMIIAMNVAYTGIEIYVPQTLLEQAQGLVEAFFSAEYAEDEEFIDEL